MGEYKGPDRRARDRQPRAGLNESDIEEIAERAAERALAGIFRHFGVDITEQKSLNSFRADLVSAHEVRKAKEASVSTFGKAVLLAIAGAVIAALTHYFGKGGN